MRDIALLLSIILSLPVTVLYPFAGILVWAWLSLMNPHREVYGLALGQPFNMIIAVVTLGAWLISREPKRLPTDAVPWLLAALAAWMTFNSFYAPDPDWSWPLWDRTIKIFLFALVALATLSCKTRIHAMVWIVALSIGYFGVRGGLFTLASGGAARVVGPDNTILSDNNHLAVAIAATLPLINYLRLFTANPWLRWGLAASMAVQVVTVLGSHSRGGVIALFCGLSVFWLRSRSKLIYLLCGFVVVGSALYMMPDSFWSRMDTINEAGQDTSFQGRMRSWKVCLYYAIDHFPFGAGFSGTQRPPIFSQYFPDDIALAAHSIYFQVLGEHGFFGLGLYLLIILLAFRNLSIVIRRTDGHPGLEWAAELARMSQVSMVTFCVGAAALSMAYYDGFLIVVVLSSALREITKVPALEKVEVKSRTLGAPNVFVTNR